MLDNKPLRRLFRDRVTRLLSLWDRGATPTILIPVVLQVWRAAFQIFGPALLEAWGRDLYPRAKNNLALCAGDDCEAPIDARRTHLVVCPACEEKDAKMIAEFEREVGPIDLDEEEPA